MPYVGFYMSGSRVEILEEVRASHNSARIAIKACFYMDISTPYMGAMTLLVMSDCNPWTCLTSSASRGQNALQLVADHTAQTSF